MNINKNMSAVQHQYFIGNHAFGKHLNNRSVI